MIHILLDTVSRLPGIVKSAILLPKHAGDIRKMESDYAGSNPVQVSNIGLQMVLERETVFVLLKNTGFRKPPIPTLYLVEEISREEYEKKTTDNKIFLLKDRFFNIVGEEILTYSDEYENARTVLNKEFALFPERISRRERRPAVFMLPPIPFPELEELQDTHSIENIMSVSPCSMSDRLLRSLYGFPEDTSLATLLVGFDSI